MRFKRQSKILFSMESVAITDIIMNMFIFFFITFSFLATFNKSNEGHVDVSLPKATSAVPLVEKKSLSVSLTKDGGLFVNEEAVTLEQLKTRLQELGYNVEGDALNQVFARFKGLADAKKNVTDADLQAQGQAWRIGCRRTV